MERELFKLWRIIIYKFYAIWRNGKRFRITDRESKPRGIGKYITI